MSPQQERDVQDRVASVLAKKTMLAKTTADLERSQAELVLCTAELEKREDELTALKLELQDALSAAKQADAANKANKAKSEFLANMSHELRTPLNSVLILAEDLEQNDKGNLSPEDLESVGIIRTGGHDLLRMINDLLDLAKVEAGHMEVCVEGFSLESVSSNLRRYFSHMAKKKNLELEILMDEDLPERLWSDQAKLDQVLKNLVGNALKFTAEGQVTVRVARSEGASKCIAFSVSDTGIGIADEKLEAIFESFCQAEGSTHQKYGGTGLGLAISRELTHLLGGMLRVESTLGQGSTFTVTLPDDLRGKAGKPAQQQPDQQKPDDLKRRNEVLKGKRVLLVDDDTRNIFALSKILKKEFEMTLFIANDGAKALEVLEREPNIDIVLMDIMMPGMDGYETMHRIRRQDHLSEVIIIAVSAKTMKVDQEKCFKAGANDFIAKPIEASALFDVMMHLQTPVSSSGLGSG